MYVDGGLEQQGNEEQVKGVRRSRGRENCEEEMTGKWRIRNNKAKEGEKKNEERREIWPADKPVNKCLQYTENRSQSLTIAHNLLKTNTCVK